MKIENDEQLAEAKRDLKAFEWHGVYPASASRLRTAIAEYENSPARIAAGLSEEERLALE